LFETDSVGERFAGKVLFAIGENAMTVSRLKFCASLFALAGLGSLSSPAFAAGPVGIDGSIGSDWAGVTPVHVGFNASAPEGNFGSPGTTSDTVGYNLYVRDDGSYYYIGAKADSTASLKFANYYLGNNTDTSYLGFEVENQRAFVPGVSGYYNYTPGSTGIVFADNFVAGSGDTIEFAVPNTFFSTNPLGIPTLPNSNTDMELRLSQTFGDSVAGGVANYGPLDLGTASVALPEPVSTALIALGGLAFFPSRRRR
jgi:hypothetical protein